MKRTQSSNSNGFGDNGFFLAITISRSVPRFASCNNYGNQLVFILKKRVTID